MTTRLALVVMGLSALAAPLGAQRPLPVDSGSRVRIVREVGAPRTITGTLVAQRADSLVIVPAGDGPPQAVARRELRSLEIRRPGRDVALDAVLGGAVGAVGGGGMGWFIGHYLLCDLRPVFRGCLFHRDKRQGLIAIGAGVGAFAGLVLTGAFSAASKGERWEPVPLEGGLAVRLLPSGAAVGVTLPLPPLGR